MSLSQTSSKDSIPEKSTSPPLPSYGFHGSQTQPAFSSRRSRRPDQPSRYHSQTLTSASSAMRPTTVSSFSKSRNFIDPSDKTFEHTISKYERSPGPVYDIGKSIDKFQQIRSPAYKIGTAPRSSGVFATKATPGPDYTSDPLKSSTHPREPRATIGRAQLTSSIIRPTPVHGISAPLPPLDTTETRAARATIGRARRYPRDLPPTPGPADYNTFIDKHITSKKGTISKADRGSAVWAIRGY